MKSLKRLNDPIFANFNISERALLEILERRRERDSREIDKESIKLFLSRVTDSGFPFQGHFDYADLVVDQSTGTYAVRGIFPNPGEEIVAGGFVKIRIPTDMQENALLVPELAIGADQAGRYVLVVDGQDVVERRNVTVGSKHRSGDPEFGDMVVIEEGLRADDRVVILGVQRARPGAKVRPDPVELPPVEDELESVRQGEASAGQPADTQPAQPQTAAPPADQPTP